MREGWRYCRLKGKSKLPLEKDWINKCTDDIETAQGWILNGDNVGLVCSKSNLVVVDVDVKNGGVEAWAAMCAVNGEPKTLIQTTPSGGKHYIFKAKPGKLYKGKIQPGIDIRYNAYICISPSSTKVGNYAYVNANAEVAVYDEWLDALIEKDLKRVNGSDVPTASNEYMRALARELKKFEYTYDEWVQIGMGMHSSDPSNEGLHCFIEASHGPSYVEGDEGKCVEKWASFHSRNENVVTILSVIHLIRSKGGEVPPTATLEDFDIVKQTAPGWLVENGKNVTRDPQTCIDFFNTNYRYFKGAKNKACIIQLNPMSVIQYDKFCLDNLSYVHRKRMKKGEKDSPAVQLWMESNSRLEIDSIVFKERATEREINLYTGFDHITEVNGEPRAVLDLIEKSLCIDESSAKWLIDFLAHIIQKPWEKSPLVPTHITSEGIGKNIIYDMVMRKILGKYFGFVSKNSEITSNFNMHLANKFLMFIDESSWSGDRDVENIMKNLTGSKILNVEEKFGAKFEVENPSRYIIASNNIEAVRIGVTNRRYLIIEANEQMRGNTEFFSPIIDAILNGDEAGKFFRYLKHRDISKYNAFVLPATTAGKDTKINSLGSVGEFWRTVFEDTVPIWRSRGLLQKEVYQRYLTWKRDTSHWEKAVTSVNFWKTTRAMSGYDLEAKPIRVEGALEKFICIDPFELMNAMEKNIKVIFNRGRRSQYYSEEF